MQRSLENRATIIRNPKGYITVNHRAQPLRICYAGSLTTQQLLEPTAFRVRNCRYEIFVVDYSCSKPWNPLCSRYYHSTPLLCYLRDNCRYEIMHTTWGAINAVPSLEGLSLFGHCVGPGLHSQLISVMMQP